MGSPIKMEVFGRIVLVIPFPKGWSVFYLGSDGKRRPAHDLFIPSSVSETEIPDYLADICHEWASEKYPEVRRL